MKCPTCKDVTLVMSERQKIEIDYCPECRGVWLDRGELDKLIEKESSSVQAQAVPAAPPTGYYRKSDDDYKREDYKRKKSFLSEIFD
jgi:uncharacterized protein